VEKESILGRSQNSEFRSREPGAGSREPGAGKHGEGVQELQEEKIKLFLVLKMEYQPEAEEPLPHSVTPELLQLLSPGPIISPR
jgi:hypothetical protein